MSKPTPETDSMELWPKEISEKIQVVRSDFARRLERERDAARALLPEVERILKPFALLADVEKNQPEGSSVLINVSRCREARALLAALKEKS